MKRLMSLIAALSITALGCGAAAGTASPSTAASTATPAAATSTPVPSPAPTAVPITVSVTWDGTTCDYRGPAVFPRGASVLWVFTNVGPALADETLEGLLIVGAVKAGTGWEDVQKSEQIPASQWPPPMSDSAFPYSAIVPPAGTSAMQMTGNEYYVGCGTSPNASDRYTGADLVYVIDR